MSSRRIIDEHLVRIVRWYYYRALVFLVVYNAKHSKLMGFYVNYTN